MGERDEYVEADCPFAEGWRNQAGWLRFGDRLVCADWDEYCTLCRDGDDRDFDYGLSFEEDESNV